MKVVTVVGTRPEIIRLSRVINRLDEFVNHVLVHTGQNYDFELNELFFDELGIRRPDHFLDSAGGSSTQTIARCIERLDEVLALENPNAILVLGDTNSGLSVIAAKKRHIPIFHMEAGNRCFDSRVPEEVNRKIIDHTSDTNLVYTEHARRNLLAEGLPADQIFLTGSPMGEVINFYSRKIDESNILKVLEVKKHEFLVASFHREENVDHATRLKTIVSSLNEVADTYQRPVIFSVHPRTKKRLDELNIKAHPLLRQFKPFGYFDYLRLQRDAFCTISDSGTVTEESAIVHFAAVTARDTHERPEGMDCGTLVMTGIDSFGMLEGIQLARAHFERGQADFVPAGYRNLELSWQVVKLIQSYTTYVNRKTWHKDRP
jgi:UDP-N-acetylglucosamine 2-epimerase